MGESSFQEIPIWILGLVLLVVKTYFDWIFWSGEIHDTWDMAFGKKKNNDKNNNSSSNRGISPSSKREY